jgi:methylated-DNA-[protein]-cysteine S-methyltransferase
MNIQTHIIIDVPFGPITISASGHYLQGIDLFSSPVVASTLSNPTIQKFIRELEAFFVQAHNTWSTPLLFHGTDFQQKVWQYLRTIPIGEMQTYSEVAKALNSSARAIGNVCHANPFPIVVPCHRVVSKQGIGGFGGKTDGQEIMLKQWLLEYERNI